MDVQSTAATAQTQHDPVMPTKFVGKCSGDIEEPCSPTLAPPTDSRKEDDFGETSTTDGEQAHSQAIPSSTTRSFECDLEFDVGSDPEASDPDSEQQQQQQQQQRQHQQQDEEESLASAADEVPAPPEVARSTSNLTLSALFRASSLRTITVMPEAPCYSPWRMPDQVGKLPVYVERQFRVKALGTVALQSWIILCLMLSIDATGLLALPPTCVKVALFATFAALSLCTLRALARSGEATYQKQLLLLLLVLPFTASMMWCSFGALLGLPVHIHMASIHTITMLLTTGYMAFQSDENRHQPIFLAISSFLLSWIVASFLQFVVAELTGLDCYVFTGLDFTSFILFTMATLEVCSRLAACDPDTFFSIIISLNSTLIVIVSIPFVWVARGRACLSSCLKRPHQEEQLPFQSATTRPQRTSAAEPGEEAANGSSNSSSSNNNNTDGGADDGRQLENSPDVARAVARGAVTISLDGPDLEIGA